MTTAHHRTERRELGYTRKVCAECGTSWPCPPAVAERCERLYLAEGLPCNCGHHEAEQWAEDFAAACRAESEREAEG